MQLDRFLRGQPPLVWPGALDNCTIAPEIAHDAVACKKQTLQLKFMDIVVRRSLYTFTVGKRLHNWWDRDHMWTGGCIFCTTRLSWHMWHFFHIYRAVNANCIAWFIALENVVVSIDCEIHAVFKLQIHRKIGSLLHRLTFHIETIFVFSAFIRALGADSWRTCGFESGSQRAKYWNTKMISYQWWGEEKRMLWAARNVFIPFYFHRSIVWKAIRRWLKCVDNIRKHMRSTSIKFNVLHKNIHFSFTIVDYPNYWRALHICANGFISLKQTYIDENIWAKGKHWFIFRRGKLNNNNWIRWMENTLKVFSLLFSLERSFVLYGSKFSESKFLVCVKKLSRIRYCEIA